MGVKAVIEFLNVLAALLAGLVAGAALHSAYVHSRKRGEFRPFPWDHEEDDDEEGSA